MAANPTFADAPVIGSAIIGNTANTNRDGTGTLYTLLTAAASGNWLRNLYLKAQGTTTAGMIRLFLYDGVNYRFWKEVSVAAIVPSATVKTWEYTELIDESIPTGTVIKASTHNGEYFYGIITGGSL
jgi:hypothetical protein